MSSVKLAFAAVGAGALVVLVLSAQAHESAVNSANTRAYNATTGTITDIRSYGCGEVEARLSTNFMVFAKGHIAKELKRDAARGTYVHITTGTKYWSPACQKGVAVKNDGKGTATYGSGEHPTTVAIHITKLG